MSQENVEVVRRWIDQMRDVASARFADFWDPDGDYYPVRRDVHAPFVSGMDVERDVATEMFYLESRA